MAGTRSGEDLRGLAPTTAADDSGLGIYKPGEDKTQWTKWLLYGPPGVGKTTLAGSAQAVPEMSEVLFVNVEGGDLALSDPSVYGAKTAPDATEFTSFVELDKIYKYLHRGGHKYKTVVIDSLSELAKYCLDAAIREKMKDPSRSGKMNRDEDDVFLEDYGTMTKRMRRVVRMFRDLPMHVIYTCHDSPTGEETNAPIGPSLTKALRKSVEGYMDIIGYMYTAEVKTEDKTTVVRKLLTSPLPRFIAKDRSPGQRLGKVNDDPSMAILMAKLRGN